MRRVREEEMTVCDSAPRRSPTHHSTPPLLAPTHSAHSFAHPHRPQPSPSASPSTLAQLLPRSRRPSILI